MLFRGALAVAGLLLALVMATALGWAEPTRAITPGECLDPARGAPDFDNIESGNAVSIWQWNATNGSNGKFTAVQTHSAPPFLDIVAIGNLLGQSWGGLGIGFGQSVFLVETGKTTGGFSFTSLKRDGSPNTFSGVAVGGTPIFIRYTATSRLLCTNNLAPSPSFEITDEDTQDEADDPPVGWSAVGWSGNSGVACVQPDEPSDPGCSVDLVDPSNPAFTGSRALRSRMNSGNCGEDGPKDNYWVSEDLGLGAEDYVLGVFTRSDASTARAEFGILIRFLGADVEYREASTRTSTSWGMAHGVVDLSDIGVGLGFTSEHLVLHADYSSCSSPPSTSTVYFDDAFIYPNTGVTP